VIKKARTSNITFLNFGSGDFEAIGSVYGLKVVKSCSRVHFLFTYSEFQTVLL